MNKTEWINVHGWSHIKYNKYYKCIQKLLKDWMIENNISEPCVVHHIDNEPEAIKYNEKFYERWGFNEDGTFEYGKHVIFMTRSEHSRHHRKGKHLSAEQKERLRIINTGKHLSAETKKKLSIAFTGVNNPFYGRKHSDETMANMRRTQALYKQYKQTGGELSWNDFQRALNNNEINIE